MSEIVIDANVFAHALNPANDYYDSALLVVSQLLKSDAILALDDTGKSSPDLRTSNLYREYAECLHPTSLSFEVIRQLLDNERVTFHLRPAAPLWKKCKQLVPRNNHDAIVLGIGTRADSHTVVSNDFDDFNHAVRIKALKEIEVVIVDSTGFAS